MRESKDGIQNVRGSRTTLLGRETIVRSQVPPRSHVIVLVEGPSQKNSLTLDSESSVYYLYTTHSTIELSLLLRLACDTLAILQSLNYLSGLRALALSHGRYLFPDNSKRSHPTTGDCPIRPITIDSIDCGSTANRVRLICVSYDVCPTDSTYACKARN
jgi:hypothetical protein